MLSTEGILIAVVLAAAAAVIVYFLARKKSKKANLLYPIKETGFMPPPSTPCSTVSPDVPMYDVHGNRMDNPDITRVGSTQSGIVDQENDLTRFQTYMVNPGLMNQHYFRTQF